MSPEELSQLQAPSSSSSLVAKYAIAAAPLNDNLVGHGSRELDASSSTVGKEVRAFSPFPSDSCAKLCEMTVMTIHQKK